ncbi:MAG: DUF3598 family protein [Leptolyngbyaceae cyanobacterium RU_5_1]|nr:DUF3598 family protein [Leptolyngbyaceae cyanobacterium RU_5_1]
MQSQWDCLLQNLGEWQGSFTRLSPQGQELEDIPTVVSLEGLNDHRTIRQTIRRLTSNPDEKVLEYSSLGQGVLLFENGAFSQGSIQFGPFSEFGAELGFIDGNYRLRLVQLFNSASQLDQLSLIREQRVGSRGSDRPPLQLNDLLGTWQGEAVTVYPDWRNPITYPTTLCIRHEDEDHLTQHLSFGDSKTGQTFSSTGIINGSILRFDQGAQPVQVLLLPGGGSSTCPIQIQSGQPFFLEAGWLLQPNWRQRMIRRYDDKGEWINLTLVTEHKAA